MNSTLPPGEPICVSFVANVSRSTAVSDWKRKPLLVTSMKRPSELTAMPVGNRPRSISLPRELTTC